MIQRIQSLYLAVVVLASTALVLVAPNLLSLTATGLHYQIRPMSVVLVQADGAPLVVSSTYALPGCLALVILLAVYSIFQFSNRKFQRQLVRLAQLAHLLVIGALYYQIDQVEKQISAIAPQLSPTLWLALIPVGLVCCFLAERAIKKDDELVRSADRLR